MSKIQVSLKVFPEYGEDYTVLFNADTESAGSLDEIVKNFVLMNLDNVKEYAVISSDDVVVEPEYTVPAFFVSVWDDYFTVESPCRVNPLTKEVSKIESVEFVGIGVSLTQMYIILDGKEHNVFQKDELPDGSDDYWYEG